MTKLRRTISMVGAVIAATTGIAGCADPVRTAQPRVAAPTSQQVTDQPKAVARPQRRPAADFLTFVTIFEPQPCDVIAKAVGFLAEPSSGATCAVAHPPPDPEPTKPNVEPIESQTAVAWIRSEHFDSKSTSLKLGDAVANGGILTTCTRYDAPAGAGDPPKYRSDTFKAYELQPGLWKSNWYVPFKPSGQMVECAVFAADADAATAEATRFGQSMKPL